MIELTAPALGCPITVTAAPAGTDWNVTILGGCSPHVGSVSLAEYKNGSVALRTLVRDSHKDQIIGDQFARTLAEQFQCTVCVVCGIHYNSLEKEQLNALLACADTLLEHLCQKIK